MPTGFSLWSLWMTVLAGVVLAQLPSVADYIAAGDKAYQRLDNEMALRYYAEALRQDPQNYEAMWKLARAYINVGEMLKDKRQRRAYYEKAKSLAQKAVELNPQGAKGHLYLSVALGRMALDAGPKERVRLSKEVKREVDIALRLDPNDDIAWHVLGRWHRRLSTLSWIERKFADIFLGGVPKEASLERAVECFQKAIELAPNKVMHHLELGITYEVMKKKDLAIAAYRKVLELPIGHAKDPEHKKEAERRLRRLQ